MEKKTKLIAFRTTPKVAEMLAAAATRRGISKSAVIRQAIQREVRRKNDGR